ncbi:unnamed protein product [Eretmochelys imbricata]
MAGAGLVAQGLKEALVETLTGILCPVQGVRAAAEEQVKVLEVTEVSICNFETICGDSLVFPVRQV